MRFSSANSPDPVLHISVCHYVSPTSPLHVHVSFDRARAIILLSSVYCAEFLEGGLMVGTPNIISSFFVVWRARLGVCTISIRVCVCMCAVGSPSIVRSLWIYAHNGHTLHYLMLSLVEMKCTEIFMGAKVSRWVKCLLGGENMFQLPNTGIFFFSSMFNTSKAIYMVSCINANV